MIVPTSEFLKTFGRALRLGEASVFVGAGLSVPAGYPDWRGLIAHLAKQIGLDSSEYHDLPALVQFFLNEDGGRGRLNDLLTEHYAVERDLPEATLALARLPLHEVWTTNYDTLVERSLRAAGVRPWVKSSDGQITTSVPFRSTTVFKMHGSIERPSECVISRDDYERYRLVRPGMHRVLAERLQSRPFLFLGAGMNDPNLNGLFSLMREMHGENTRPHFAVMRRAGAALGPKADFDRRARELWLRELQRYGLRIVEVDEFADIPLLLDELRRRVLRGTVFVSGAYPDDGSRERTLVLDTSRRLGEQFARRGIKVISGFGNAVGGALISGVLEGLQQNGAADTDHALGLHPFPQEVSGPERDRLYGSYREGMVRKAGVAVFVGGVAAAGTDAPGVTQEWELSVKHGLLSVPLGATGGAAATAWTHVAADYARLSRGMDRALFDRLNDRAASAADLAATVSAVFDWWTGET